MMKRIQLDVPEDSYQKLVSLSDFYKQDVKDAIVNILDLVGETGDRIVNLSGEFKVPVSLVNVLSILFEAGFTSISCLSYEVLKDLGAKGLCALDDWEMDLDEGYMSLTFSALEGCDLQISIFHVIITSGDATLMTHSYVDTEKADNKALGRLKTLVRNVEAPPEFADLDDFDVELDEDKEFFSLRIRCSAESFGYLPSVNKVSKFIKRVFKRTGIKNT